MKFLIIAGHGAGDPGATGYENRDSEANCTRELAALVVKKLKAYGVVDLYDTSRNAFADVQNGRFSIGKYDYVLELHFNSFNGSADGTEIFVTDRETDTDVEQEIMHKMSKFFKLRGVKTTNFLVINTIKDKGISSALLETCFIDNKEDFEKYKANKNAIAQAIVDGIAEGFKLKKTTTTTQKGETMKQINPMDWINSHKGQIYDIDGVAGVQCVDLYKIFLKDIGYPNPTRAIGGDGYADNIWYRRSELGLSKYFDFVQGQCKTGDIVLWKKGAAECPSSHVAMFVNDDPANPARGVFLGSNQGYAHSKGVLTSISMSGSLGALRYKGFANVAVNKPASKPAQKAPDQILTKDSKVKFDGKFIVEGVDGDWVYNAVVGGGLPAQPLYEDSARDGKQDQILHVGATFTYPGTFTVQETRGGGYKNAGQAYLTELKCWVNCAALTEVRESR